MGKTKVEPKLGVINVRLLKGDSKIRAFCDVIVPTIEFGDITIRNFKVVEGNRGLFVSLPNRAAKTKGGVLKDPNSDEVIRTVPERTRYYNDIRFESLEKFNEFREELNRHVLTVVKEQIDKAA